MALTLSKTPSNPQRQRGSSSCFTHVFDSLADAAGYKVSAIGRSLPITATSNSPPYQSPSSDFTPAPLHPTGPVYTSEYCFKLATTSGQRRTRCLALRKESQRGRRPIEITLGWNRTARRDLAPCRGSTIEGGVIGANEIGRRSRGEDSIVAPRRDCLA